MKRSRSKSKPPTSERLVEPWHHDVQLVDYPGPKVPSHSDVGTNFPVRGKTTSLHTSKYWKDISSKHPWSKMILFSWFRRWLHEKNIYNIYTFFNTQASVEKKGLCFWLCESNHQTRPTETAFCCKGFFEVGPRTTSCKWGYIPYIPFNNLKTFNTSSLGFWMTSDPKQKFLAPPFTTQEVWMIHHWKSLKHPTPKSNLVAFTLKYTKLVC